jgi:hypothetical protein
MLHYRLIAASALIAFAPFASQAQDTSAVASAPASSPAAITVGAFLKTADGKRAGQIFSLDKAADGSIGSAALIGPNSVLVHVPISTITAVDKSHFMTSLTYKQIFN